ncbi:Mbeg1-like protein [Treponema sp.]|uniref:Mbeg1-like protein n=1 Tax=Treponema sp. TaxID=166 RepID=UPI00298E3FDB|nr:Mbeg1-like protein [Treponema sp.]
MANIIDYILWRGDLSFKQSTFNEVDAVILCQISYLNYDGILSSDFKSGMTLKNLWQAFKHTADFKKRCDPGALINSDTYKVLEAAADSPRFSSVSAAGYVNKIDRSIDEQFSAVTYFLGGTNKNPYVVFKGTDDTLTGWKEDFNMSFSTSVPAQKDAVSYIDRVSKITHGKINILGHSKGGNLAVYAACYMNKYFKPKVEKIFNFDGPGFPKDMIDSREFTRIKDKINTWYPQKDLVGMFFEHAEKYTVVRSSASGAWQHDAMSWFVEGSHFVTEAELDKKSVYFNKIFNSWLKTVTPEKLKQVTDTIFEFLENKR